MPAASRRHLTVEVDESLAAFVDRQVAEGRYPNSSVMVEKVLEDRLMDEALAGWGPQTGEEREAIYREAVADYLRTKDDPSAWTPLKEAFEKLRAKRAARGGPR